jgi:serine/threonine protein kinase
LLGRGFQRHDHDWRAHPDYVAEQVKGEDVDGRSDIFALGIILYELLTGKMPYKAETVQKSMYKRTVERAIPASVETPGVDPFLSEVVSKCLEIAPDSRYSTARELWSDLEKWRNGETGGAHAVVTRLLRQLKANRTLVLTRSGVVVIAAVLLFRTTKIPSRP